MMSFSAPHIGFVLASYGVSAAVMLALVIFHVVRARRTRARLDELQARGASRRKRSERPS